MVSIGIYIMESLNFMHITYCKLLLQFLYSLYCKGILIFVQQEHINFKLEILVKYQMGDTISKF